jgi:hypothetical protein
LLVFNGVDATSGDYLLPPMPAATVSLAARGEVVDPEHLRELRERHWAASEAFLGVKEGVDPTDLAQSGWGVVFAPDTDPAVREALTPLLEHRRAQAGPYFREFSGADAYRPGESKQDFLARHGAGPGAVDPTRVPYYLMLVGSPVAIPYRVQYQLDVQYAVGRLDLDSPEAYASYARSVVATESGTPKRRGSAALFAPANRDDPATALSSSTLVAPLAEALTSRNTLAVTVSTSADATKGCLGRLVNDNAGPALLFSASHGLGFPSDHPEQRARQGALVCQEWEGPYSKCPVGTEQSFAAADVADDAELSGLLYFMFACFGGGTPQFDDFAARTPGTREQLAPEPFGAALPKRLLGHPRGGALAVIAHVDRAWGYSFHWPSVGAQTAVYESALLRLVDGKPVGFAFEYFNERYAELASDLSALLEDIRYGKVADHNELAGAWTANNDARGFAIFGDPAVRMAVAS